jgi:hypothetical protein
MLRKVEMKCVISPLLSRSGVRTFSIIKVSPFFFRFIMIPRNAFPERTVFHISS